MHSLNSFLKRGSFCLGAQGQGSKGERACLALMLLVLFVDHRFDGRTRPKVSRHKTAGGEENERNSQRPRSVQQRLRLKGKSE
jgi:hypothetical protein